MTIFEKFVAKATTYSNRIKCLWFRFVHFLFPGYFQIGKTKSRIFHLGYAFPDELFKTDIPPKKELWAEVIPGLRETYRFSEEDDYFQMYADARFAFTWKKEGWDCLRHYEILANGTIPVFPNLGKCPDDTLSHLPKHLIIQATKELLPWKDIPEYHLKYNAYLKDLLSHSRKHASCSAVAFKFLENLGANPSQKILFLNCDVNINYSRELLFIGLSKLLNENQGSCFGYPKLDFLYDDFPIEKARKCYGKGFGYTRRLKAESKSQSFPYTTQELEKSIASGYWDFVVYGKIGLDEGKSGTAPTCPFWKTVSNAYPRNKIAFVFGGDHIQNLDDMGSPYSRHLAKHAKLGKCFVRELKLN